MRRWLFHVPTKNIGTMRLFALADLPLLLAFRPAVWFANVSRLHQYQNNLSERQWASLAEIYPRTLMWGYAYQLFFWGRYCSTLSEILSSPERSLLAEVFLRYICQIDVYIDSWDSQTVLQRAPIRVKNHPPVWAVAEAFCKRMASLAIPIQSKISIARLVASYRREALTVTQQWSSAEFYSLNDLIAYKERTVGKLMYSWSQILGKLYQPSNELLEEVSKIFFNFAMALQFVDDLSDVGQDYRVNTQNLFLGIVTEDPEEWNILRAYLDNMTSPYMHWPWVRENIPRSYQMAKEIHKGYLQAMQTNKRKPELTDELRFMLDRLVTLVGYGSLSEG